MGKAASHYRSTRPTLWGQVVLHSIYRQQKKADPNALKSEQNPIKRKERSSQKGGNDRSLCFAMLRCGKIMVCGAIIPLLAQEELQFCHGQPIPNILPPVNPIAYSDYELVYKVKSVKPTKAKDCIPIRCYNPDGAIVVYPSIKESARQKFICHSAIHHVVRKGNISAGCRWEMVAK